MPCIVLGTEEIDVFLLGALSDLLAQSCYKQLIHSTYIHGEARVTAMLSHFHVFRQCGRWINSFTIVGSLFCLTYSPSCQNMSSKKTEQLDEPKFEIHRVLKDMSDSYCK